MEEFSNAQIFLGRLAYESYSRDRDGKAHDGSPIPGWNDVREEIRHAWIRSSDDVAKYVMGGSSPEGATAA